MKWLIILFLLCGTCWAEELDWKGKKDYKREYKEWCYVNLHKDLFGGACYDGECWNGGYKLCKIYDEKQFLKNYFPDKTLKELENKWLNKSMPQGFKQFCKKYNIFINKEFK